MSLNLSFNITLCVILFNFLVLASKVTAFAYISPSRDLIYIYVTTVRKIP